MAERGSIAIVAPYATASTASLPRLPLTCSPERPQLWQKHPNSSVIGVSDNPPGETYWKIANGIRLTGMPAFKDLLSETEMWQVSLLLANADKLLPPEALQMVRGSQPAAAGAGGQKTDAAPAAGKEQ